jgi:hypothetical protein
VPTAPPVKRSATAVDPSTSAPSTAGGMPLPAAHTSVTSPARCRARSSTCAACSTTGPPDLSARGHQATGGTLSSQAPVTSRTGRSASSAFACSTTDR